MLNAVKLVVPAGCKFDSRVMVLMSAPNKKNLIVAAVSASIGMIVGAAAALIVIEKRFTYKLHVGENLRKSEEEFGESLVEAFGSDQP